MSSVRYAGFWIRALAHLLDSILLEVVTWLAQLMLLGAVYWVRRIAVGGDTLPFWDGMNSLAAQVVNAVIYGALALVYFGYGQFRYVTTLGKVWLGIRVVNASDLGPMTLLQSMIRCVSYLVSYLPLGTGFLMAAFHPEKRALHDLLAGTVSIIKERE